MRHVYMQRLCTKNDTNGNPRRLFVFYHAADGHIVAVVDEGYSGRPNAARVTEIVNGLTPEGGRVDTWDVVELPDVNVQPAEYASWKGYARETHKWHASM